MDLEKFFDTVNQSMLTETLSRTIKDNRVISLIMIFTKSKRAAERQYTRASKFIEGKLKLKINKEKTKISRLNKIIIYLLPD